MKPFKIILSTAIIFGFSALAGNATEIEIATRKFEVLQIEKSRVGALVRNDLRVLDKILAEDLIYIHSNAIEDSKASFVESLSSGRLRYKSLAHESEVVRLFGDTAILTGVSEVVSIADGEELRLRLRFTIVYCFRDGRWQMVSWQSGRLPDPVEVTSAPVTPVVLWAENTPQPKPDTVETVPGVQYKLIHSKNADYRFLHEPRLEWHGGKLIVDFTNAPRQESEPAQVLRGRWSEDGGANWSKTATLVENPPGGDRYETGPLLSTDGELYLFLGRYGIGGRRSLGMEVRRMNSSIGKFEPLANSELIPDFVPFGRPQKLDNGNWIIPGHADQVKTAAVAISAAGDFTRWRVVRISTPKGYFYPETALLIKGAEVVAVSRNDKKNPKALVALSRDFGESFTPAAASNLEMSDAKPFGGTLSSGQRFLIYNGLPDRNGTGTRNRNDLFIAVTRPEELLPLRKAWRIISGKPPEAGALSSSKADDAQEWCYPEAVEHEGSLYVVFSQNKQNAWLAKIPVSALKLD